MALQNSRDSQEIAGQQPEAAAETTLKSGDPGQVPVEGSQASSPANRPPGDQEVAAAADLDDEPLLNEIHVTVGKLADSAERYHTRAEHRESVIDHLRDEVERLRRGERRGLLRPLLAEICRLRNDLLGQADGLPNDYDAEQAARLLRSYADSVELTLENSGVVAFEPDTGTPFDPRMHRRVGAEPTRDPALLGRIARVRRCGYLDVDANNPIAAAEVVLFAAASGEPGQSQPASMPQPESAAVHSEVPYPASGPDARDEL